MSEIIEALNQLEKEKNISKDILLDAIERSLKAACKKDFDTDENIDVVMDRETGEFHVYAKKEVVEEVERPATQISLEKAKMMNSRYHQHRDHNKGFRKNRSTESKKCNRSGN